MPNQENWKHLLTAGLAATAVVTAAGSASATTGLKLEKLIMLSKQQAASSANQPQRFLHGTSGSNKTAMCFTHDGKVGVAGWRRSGNSWLTTCTAGSNFSLPLITTVPHHHTWRLYNSPPSQMPHDAYALRHGMKVVGAPCLGFQPAGSQWLPGIVPIDGPFRCKGLFLPAAGASKFKLLRHKKSFTTSGWVSMGSVQQAMNTAIPIRAVNVSKGKVLCTTGTGAGFVVQQGSSTKCRIYSRPTGSWKVHYGISFKVYAKPTSGSKLVWKYHKPMFGPHPKNNVKGLCKVKSPLSATSFIPGTVVNSYWSDNNKRESRCITGPNKNARSYFHARIE